MKHTLAVIFSLFTFAFKGAAQTLAAAPISTNAGPAKELPTPPS